MILSLYGRIRVSQSPYFHIFFAMEAIVKKIKKHLIAITTNYLFKDKHLTHIELILNPS